LPSLKYSNKKLTLATKIVIVKKFFKLYRDRKNDKSEAIHQQDIVKRKWGLVILQAGLVLLSVF